VTPSRRGEKNSSLFELKMVTPSVAAPRDTNFSDTTACRVRIGLSSRLRYRIGGNFYIEQLDGNRNNKKYVLWNVYLPNALHSVCLNRLSCTEVGIYNGANSPNGFLTPAIA